MNEQQSTFTDQDMTVENYNRFSVESLVLFFPSIIVALIIIVNKFMIPVGLILATIAFIYLVFVALANKKYSGIILAKLSLFLLLACCSGSYLYHQHRFQHLSELAKGYAQDYLDLVKQDRMHEAYQMTLNYDFRTKPGTDLIRNYGTREQPGPEMQVYLRQQPEAAIRKAGEKSRITPFLMQYKKSKVIRETFTFRYKFEPLEGGEERIFDIAMLRFDYPTPPGPQWFVEGLLNVKPAVGRTVTNEQMGASAVPDDL